VLCLLGLARIIDFFGLRAVSGLGRFGVRGRFFFGLDTVGAGLIVVAGSEHRGSLGWRGEHRGSRALRGGQGRVAPA
jgi:hypothetical protein